MEITLKATEEEIIHKFNSLQTKEDVANLLEVSVKDLIYLIYRNKSNNYKQITLTKKNGGLREIHSPTSSLKILQQKLNCILSLVFEPKSSAHGFVSDKSILTNAQNHTKKKYILNIDLQDFFPSINFGRVRGLFIGFFKLPDEVATVLAQICCRENSLPQGAPSSPIISNIICSKLDNQLIRLAKRYSCNYTRYADDISISSAKNMFPKNLASYNDETNKIILGSELTNVIVQNGFMINDSKTRLLNKKERLEVTGLTVNKHPNVRRTFIRQIRAMLHAWEKYGLQLAENEYYQKYEKKNRSPKKSKPNFKQIVKGKINFVRMVKGEGDPIYRKLAIKYNSLNNNIGFPIYNKDPIEEISSALWVLECEDSFKQGTGFMLEGVGLVTCYHVLGTNTKAFQHREQVKYPIKVLYKDEINDLAILIIDSKNNSSLQASKKTKFQHRLKITVAGFPNYSFGDSPYISDGKLTLNRVAQKRYMVSATIVTGNSGGPVLDSDNKVIGIASMGVNEFSDSSTTEKHGIIPLQIIDYLLP